MHITSTYVIDPTVRQIYVIMLRAGPEDLAELDFKIHLTKTAKFDQKGVILTNNMIVVGKNPLY